MSRKTYLWFNSGYWRENTSMNIVSNSTGVVTYTPMSNLVSKLADVTSTWGNLQCHKGCLPDLQSLSIAWTGEGDKIVKDITSCISWYGTVIEQVMPVDISRTWLVVHRGNKLINRSSGHCQPFWINGNRAYNDHDQMMTFAWLGEPFGRDR